MDDKKVIPQSLIIAEARAKVESVLTAENLSPAVKELIFKEAWLRASIMADQEVQRDYDAYKKANQEAQQEEE